MILSKIIKEWEIESECNEPVRFSKKFNEDKITIYASRVGILIGRQGITHQKYLAKIKERDSTIKEISYVEVGFYSEDVNKDYLSEYVRAYDEWEKFGENFVDED
jgi:ribosomal protein S3